MTTVNKKRMLVPLNRAGTPNRRARIMVRVFRPVSWILRKVYNPCFGWLDRRIARQNERRFADEVRTHLPFLFSEYGARIIPNEGVPFPPSFDGAFVTLALDPLRLRFSRGRGDFGVQVASEFFPQQWEEFRLVADGVGPWDIAELPSRRYDLETFEAVLRPRIDALRLALSKDNAVATLEAAVAIHNASVDRYAAKLRKAGVEPKLF